MTGAHHLRRNHFAHRLGECNNIGVTSEVQYPKGTFSFYSKLLVLDVCEVHLVISFMKRATGDHVRDSILTHVRGAQHVMF